ncbi:hypothetical protein LOTGIDRAFT_142368, partial [Lottia gigantea]
QYGQIHIIIRQMVIGKYGHDMWDTILKKSGLDDSKHFLVFSQYDDSLTYKVVGAASECLDLPVNTVLEVFGDYFIMHVLRHGYDTMLRTLGNNMWNFIQNLDSLHSLLALSYKEIRPPSFRCESGEDGDLLLHYYSVRSGLAPLVLGTIRAVGRDIFKQRVEITALGTSSEEIAGKTQEHTTFKVFKKPFKACRKYMMQVKLLPFAHMTSQCQFTIFQVKLFDDEPENIIDALEGAETNTTIEKSAFEMCPFQQHMPYYLSPHEICKTFPYHIIFDKEMMIKQCGYQVKKMLPAFQTPPICMSDNFEVVHPRMALTIENISKFINSIFFISVKHTDDETKKNGVCLKGQMSWLEDSGHMIFVGSLRLSSFNELAEKKVFMSDIPLYDVTRELVLLHEQRSAEIDYAQKLDETTAELKVTSKALESEKKKTEMLLYQMLPQKVAHQLKNGKQVEAEKFEEVTILFSDIVTFTTISAACTPLQIVNMLNDLYQRFDQKTDQHGVYKVETIGDAYMIVCGVPEKTKHHSIPVARFAIDMVLEANQVTSPHTGQPIQIRVGVHTGPVVAGVVGVKMPRYCLFGDTVNTASRMESHGLPGRIHISPTTYQSLGDSGFLYKQRGDITVKGKGCMATYFLVGSDTTLIEEPNDAFSQHSVLNQNIDLKVCNSSKNKIDSKTRSRACEIL